MQRYLPGCRLARVCKHEHTTESMLQAFKAAVESAVHKLFQRSSMQAQARGVASCALSRWMGDAWKSVERVQCTLNRGMQVCEV